MNRRTIVGSLMTLAVAGISYSGPLLAQAEKELVIAFFGGRWEAVLKESLADFEREQGVKIVWIAGNAVENLATIQAQRARPQIDLAFMDDIPARAGRKAGVWEKLDDSMLPNKAKLYDLAKLTDNDGIGVGMYAYGLFYNKKIFAERGWAPPNSWYDLFRPEFRGHTIMTGMTTTAAVKTLIMFARLEGGDERNIEPGWKKMKEFAQGVVAFPRNSAIVSQHIERQEAWLGVWDNIVAGQLADTGFPLVFVLPKEGAPGQLMSAHIIKGAPHPKIAYVMLNYLLSDKMQVVLAQKLLLGPVNRDVRLPPELASRVVYGPEQMQKLMIPDLDYVTEQRPGWIERFSKEVAK